MTKKERILELTVKLDEAARAYYQEDREIMSNFEYDALYDELLALEKETGIVMAGSPTNKVGYEILSQLEKVDHESPMLSLDKTKSPEDRRSCLKNAGDTFHIGSSFPCVFQSINSAVAVKTTSPEEFSAVSRES